LIERKRISCRGMRFSDLLVGVVFYIPVI